MRQSLLLVLSLLIVSACAHERHAKRKASKAHEANEASLAWNSGDTAFGEQDGPPGEDETPSDEPVRKGKKEVAAPDDFDDTDEVGALPTEEALDGGEDSSKGYVAGTLYFFDRDDRSIVKNFDAGLDVGGIRWGKAISAGNPGVDCTLKLRKQGGDANNYACVMREGRHAVVVNMSEASLGGRALKSISVDAKGKATLERWQAELEAMGFAKVAQGPAGRLTKWSFAAKDGHTQAELIYAAAADAVTVIFKPAGDAWRAAASVSKTAHKKHKAHAKKGKHARAHKKSHKHSRVHKNKARSAASEVVAPETEEAPTDF